MVSDILHRLDESTRDILVLTYLSGKSPQEVADLLGITPEAVEQRLQQARHDLGDQGIEQLRREAGAQRDTRAQSAHIMGRISRVPIARTIPSRATSLKRLLAVAAIAATGIAALVAAVVFGYKTHSPTASALSSPALRNAAAEAAPKTEKRETVNAGSSITQGRRLPVLPDPGWSGPASIYGLVVYPDGRPAAGAQVGLIRGREASFEEGTYLPPYAGDPPNRLWKMLQTDAQGRFTFPNLPFIDYCLFAQTPDGLCVRSVYSSRLASESRIDKLIVLELRPAATLEGTITDSEGQPVEKAVVYPFEWESVRGEIEPLSDAWQKSLAVSTDLEGRFHLRGLWKSRWRLRVSAPGQGAVTTDLLFPGDTSPRISLAPGHALTGQVRLADSGASVAGVTVSLLSPSAPAEPLRVITDAEGRFRMDGVPGESWLALLDDADLTLPDGTVSFATSAQETRLELLSVPGAVLAGRVQEADARPPRTGYQVVAWRDQNVSGFRMPHYSAVTDTSGAFRITGVPAGAYTLELVQAGETLMPAEKTVRVEVDQGKTVDGLILTAPHDPNRHVAGMVVDSLGHPMVGAAVTGEEEGKTAELTFSDNSGRFELTDLTPGPASYAQARRGDQLTSVRVPVRGATDALVLTLERAAGLDGHLVDAEGLPLLSGYGRAVVTAVPAAPQSAPAVSALTGIGGGYRLTGLTAGTYNLWIEAENAAEKYPPRTRVGQVALEAGQQLSGYSLVYTRPEGELAVAGRVLTQTGEPVAEAWVNATGTVKRGALTNAEGRFVIQGLTPGSYDLAARSAKDGLATRPAVPAGQQDVELVLQIALPAEGI